MKPEARSRFTLSVTQSKAKMYEYYVPLEDHIESEADSTRLFPLTIGMLGDLAGRINDGNATAEEILELRSSLPFSARFFDAFIEARLSPENNMYVRLLGAAAYYLCDLPGNSKILAEATGSDAINLDALGIENLLVWILRKNYTKTIELPDSPFRESLARIYQLLLQFDQTGIGENIVIEQCNVLRRLIYGAGTPQQLLLGDLIGAIVRVWLQKSIWTTIPRFSGLSSEKWTTVFQKKRFIRDLWPAQLRLGEQGIFRGKSAIIQMPTSAGKTKAAEVIIRSAFLAERISLAIIVAPFRALCHEVKDTLVDAFRGEAIFIDELSDNLQVDFSAERFLNNNQILIVTPEKLNYVLRHSPEIANKIGLLIYDEGHQFDNGRRGITYELLLTTLKKKISPQAQTILISAVISNADQIGTWLLGEGFEVVHGNDLLPTFRSIAFASWIDRRGQLKFVNPIDIDESEFFVPRIIEQFELKKKPRERKDRVFPERSEGNQISLYLGLRLIPNGSVAIYCGQKASVTTICEKAVDIFERGVPLITPINNGNDVAEIGKLSTLHIQNLGETSVFTRSAKLGIFAHHNNIPHGIRLAIENAIKKGLVGFVVCTSTLAQGVNLPIRYLFVTSTYQGGDEIKVRDFQNLIGRSGRADQHTEGSIIFADPKIIDQHVVHEDFYWNKAKRLLKAENSEPCVSTLFSIFENLISKDERYYIKIDPFDLVQAYNNGNEAIEKLVSDIVSRHSDSGFTTPDLTMQIRYKTYFVGAIESYLMANWDESLPAFDEDAITDLAKGTLAYFLANNEQKEQIVKLFTVLAQNIVQKVPDIRTRVVFGRTLFGLQDAVAISDWVNENISQITTALTDQDMLEVLWPLISANINTSSFRNCNRPDLLLAVSRSWLSGNSFAEIWDILASADARTITQSHRYKVEDVVDICENGFGYDGMLVLGALIELISVMQIENIDLLINNLKRLQKRLKYGLSNETSIVFYELGFADRVVAIDLSSLFEEAISTKDLAIQALKGQREQVFAKLDTYPSYFSEVYRNRVALVR